MNLSGDKRLVVIGQPGAGKTTFVKHIVYKWANYVEGNEKNAPLNHFVLVIPIVLRLVKPYATLTDILREQLPLNELDICIIQHTMKCSTHLMLVMDGYDEMACQGIIQKIIRKEKFPNATVIITTRPHGLPLIHQLGYGAVQMLVEITGFDSKQIQVYIDKFMLANGEKAQDTLFKHVCKHDSLMKLATNPTKLEIICFVWLIHGNLGERVSDLYQTFLVSLLKHMERKMQSTLVKDVSDNKLFRRYYSFLMKISRMANTWDENGYLQAIFSHKELEAYLGDDLEKVKQLGCIVKYNPSKSEQSSDWSFTHLTLQYYFIAYFLSESTKEDARQFAECCSPIQHMDTVRGIMQFLCALDSRIANTVLQTYTDIINEKHECLKLQRFLCQLVNEYTSKADIDIPLPEWVLFTQEEDTKSLKVLSHTDSVHNHRNVKHIEVKRLTHALKQFDMSYVPNISLSLRHPNEFEIMADSIKKAIKLQKLDIVLQSNDTVQAEVEKLLTNAPECLTEIYTSGYNIFQPVSKVLSTFQQMTNVHLKDKMESTEKQKSCFSKTMTDLSNADISIEQELLDPSFFPVEYPGKLKLHFFGTRNDELDQVKLKIMNLDTGCFSNIKCLNLSGRISKKNDLSSQGDAISLFLVKLSNMDTFRIDYCKINSNFLVEMAHKIVSENTALPLKCLTMNGNNLKEGGAELGKILHFTPNLTELGLGDNQLSDEDFDQIAMKESFIPQLRVLNVSGNVFQKSSSRGLQDILKNKRQLTVLNIGWCNMDASITDSIFSDTRFQSLEELDLRYNHLGDGELHSLASHMSQMPSLKVLNLSHCGCGDADELVMLCGSIPPSLEELDVRSNPFNKDIVKVILIT